MVLQTAVDQGGLLIHWFGGLRLRALGFRVQGLRFRVCGFRVEGLCLVLLRRESAVNYICTCALGSLEPADVKSLDSKEQGP